MNLKQSCDLGPDFTVFGFGFALLESCAVFVGDSQKRRNPVAVEFGVAAAHSTRIIAEHMPVTGFDSFEGLPEDWTDEFPAGTFSEFNEPTDIPNATFVRGWYKDTVPDYDWPENIYLVHIDCDLYSSTKTVLEAIGPKLNYGTVIVFDEWHGYDGCKDHEQKAWLEFAIKHTVEWEVIGHSAQEWAIKIISTGDFR